MVFVIGTLVGLEIPLLMRILKDELDFKELVSRVLALDYVGALGRFAAVSRSFSCRNSDLTRTSFDFRNVQCRSRNLGNVAARKFDQKARFEHFCESRVLSSSFLLLIAFIKADTLTSLAEDALFVDNIIYAKSSPYQRIVVTKGKIGYATFSKRQSAI